MSEENKLDNKSQDDQAGKPSGESGDQGKKSGNSSNLSIENLQQQLKQRDGTISAQDKKINTLEDSVNQLTNGLKEALGLKEDDNDKKEDLLTTVSNELADLKARANKADAIEVLDKTLNSYRDENGKPLPDNIKSYIRQKANVTTPDEEQIASIVKNEASSLVELLNSSGARFVDGSPDSKGYVGKQAGHRPTANEILASIEKNN